jgi:hypothetical protein
MVSLVLGANMVVHMYVGTYVCGLCKKSRHYFLQLALIYITFSSYLFQKIAGEKLFSASS